MELKDVLENLLEDKNLTARQLSKILGMDHSSFYVYLSGGYPKIHNAVIIANYFNCSLNYLFGLDDKPNQTHFNSFYDETLFIDRYEKLLIANKISNHKLCKDTGVNRSSLFLWKNGSPPKCETLIKIADYLGCSVDYLVGRSDKI